MLGLALCLFSVPAFACLFNMAMQERDLKRVERVFIGEMINYQPHPQAADVKELTFRIKTVFKGQIDTDELKVFWLESGTNFSPPVHQADFLRLYGNEVLVGLAPLNKYETERLSFPLAQAADDSFWILQTVCSGAFVFPYNWDKQFFNSLSFKLVLQHYNIPAPLKGASS